MFNTTLATANLHTPYVVRDVVPPEAEHEWANWLAEIGFLEGEPVSVIARGALGGDPLVVRIGVSTFANSAVAALVSAQSIAAAARAQ
jgi:ferrous iron transport protein A